LALDIKEIFGLNVKVHRTRLRLTQELFAERAGTNQAYLSMVERGTAVVSIEMIGRLAEALGVRPAELFDENIGRPAT